MKAVQRRKFLSDLLDTKPFVSLKELMDAAPGMSHMTLRRDIEYFESIGAAIKVRGGARSMKFITTSAEDAFSKRLVEDIEGKEKIAEKAIQLIEPGRSIFFDSGTTMLTLAKIIPDERVNIVTTGPNVALEIIKKSKPVVSIIGGMLNKDNISVVGNQALNYVDSINIDIAFIVPSGISADGITCGNYTECELKRRIVQKANKVVVLVNSSKLDKILPYTVCDINKADIIIADQNITDRFKSYCDANNIEIIYA